ALAGGDRLAHQRTLAPLAVQHALGLSDQHLRSLLRRGQRLLQRAAHALDVVGAPDRPDPLDADAAHRVLDLVSGTAGAVLGARRRNVLAAGRRGVVVLDHDGDVVALVEHGIGDAAGEPVVPETAVAHDADRALASGHVQRAGRGRAEAVAHRRVPDV